MSPSPLHNPHDRFFRSAMAQKPVAIDFFNHHLPPDILRALEIESLELDPNSYIDDRLQERISDLIFSCKLADKPAYLAILVEHQSKAELLLPFRVHSYLFRLLENWEKRHPDRSLPAVYALVFYQGKRSPYPYSLSLWDCFDDPLQLMPKILYQPVPLIDINQLSDEELKQQAWVGPMARALKHVRESDVAPFLLDIPEDMQRLHGSYSATGYIRLLINYLLKAGEILDLKRLFEEADQRLSQPIRSEIMTGAEKLKELGRQEGLEKGLEKGLQKGLKRGQEKRSKDIALKLLQEGADLAFISKMTDLSIEEIKRLKPAE